MTFLAFQAPAHVRAAPSCPWSPWSPWSAPPHWRSPVQCPTCGEGPPVAISTEYPWNIYGISMEYLWFMGISMEYLWFMGISMEYDGFQWPFQEPKFQVPCMYKACFSSLCKGISPRKYGLVWYSTSILGSWNSH